MSNSPATSPWIKNVTDESFEQDVVEASRQRPVVVDFWAEWCQPCLMLKPLLEQAAVDRDGEFLLAKCNTNETPQTAGQFGVQGIPAVFAVFEGDVVDRFDGFIPEDALGQWLDRLALLGQLAQAQRQEASDAAAAEAVYRKLLGQQSELAEARIGLARTLLAQKDEEGCRAEIELLEKRGFLEPEAQRIKSQLELDSQQDVDLPALAAQSAADPDNLELQVQLGGALASHEKYQEALDTLLAVVERDKAGVGDLARQRMLDIFRILGDEHEMTRQYRRRLSAALY